MPGNQKQHRPIIHQAVYHFLRLSFYLWSLLPLSWLYGFCRIMAWIVFGVFRYRRHVIKRNLEIVFPEKSPEYRKKIERKFIHHFADMIAEYLKIHSMGQNEFRRRFDIRISAELQKECEEGNDVFFAGAHVNNWEWAVVAAGDQLPIRAVAVYKPLSNKAIDKITISLREKLNTRMVPMAQVIRDLLSTGRPPSGYIFLSDQSTPHTMTAHRAKFFGIETPFVSGMSIMAVRQNIPIYYFYIEKVKRGYYKAGFTLLVREPKNYSPDEITEMYSKKVMENILNQPSCWLWTHKRWKRVLQY